MPIKPLALTLGEPAGIGPDIALTAWMRRRELALPPFYLAGDKRFLDGRAKKLGLKVPVASVAVADAAAVFAESLPVVETGVVATAEPGQPDDSSAAAALASIRHAVDDVRSGRAAAVVTNPIAKSVVYRAGFKHPGHTEFLAELAADGAAPPRPVMMLWSPVLAVIPVTIHVALREAVAQLTTRDIVETCTIAANELRRYFGLANPRIAVSGLNPHAGEYGSLGTEDEEIVAPGRGCIEERRHRRARTVARRHHVPRSRAQDLRLRGLHVSRPGADPDQDAGVRRRGQRHARLAVHPHVAGSRDRLRHRRHRPRQSVEPDRSASSGRAHGERRAGLVT